MNERFMFRTPGFYRGKFVGFMYYEVECGAIKNVINPPCNVDIFGADEQCTGLKDKNGILMYENDKVVHGNKFILSNGKPEEKVGFIKFDKKLARFVITGEYLNSDMNAENCVYQIIGNIHTDKG